MLPPATHRAMPEVFPIAPPGPTSAWMHVLPAVLLLVGLAPLVLLAYTLTSVGKARFEVADGQLHIRGDLYGRRIPVEALRLDEARLVDQTEDRAFSFRLRTNGIGLPSYSSGWFRLRSGEKALAFVTDRRRVLYIPTTGDYVLLVSPADPDRLLAALRAARSP